MKMKKFYLPMLLHARGAVKALLLTLSLLPLSLLADGLEVVVTGVNSQAGGQVSDIGDDQMASNGRTSELAKAITAAGYPIDEYWNKISKLTIKDSQLNFQDWCLLHFMAGFDVVNEYGYDENGKPYDDPRTKEERVTDGVMEELVLENITSALEEADIHANGKNIMGSASYLFFYSSSEGLLNISQYKCTAPNSIGQNALCFANKLKKLTITGTTKTIDNWAFRDCANLESVYLPDVTNINTSAFLWDTSMNNVEIPSVVNIGNAAFMYNKAIEKVVLPASLKTIGFAAFYSSKPYNLKYVIFEGEDVPEFGATPFEPEFTNVYVPYTALKEYEEADMGNIKN